MPSHPDFPPGKLVTFDGFCGPNKAYNGTPCRVVDRDVFAGRIPVEVLLETPNADGDLRPVVYVKSTALRAHTGSAPAFPASTTSSTTSSATSSAGRGSGGGGSGGGGDDSAAAGTTTTTTVGHIAFELHLRELRGMPGSVARLQAHPDQEELLRALRAAVRTHTKNFSGIEFVNSNNIDSLLRPFFKTDKDFATWTERAIYVAERLGSRNHCSDALTGPGVWYPTNSVLAITAHPNLWQPATQLRLKTFVYNARDSAIPYVFTMRTPASGCAGETAFNEAEKELLSLLNTFPCRRCDSNMRHISRIVDACGPLLARAVGGLPDDHAVLKRLVEAQLTMLQHCVLEMQVLNRDGTFVCKRQSDSDAFGGASLFDGGLTSNGKSFFALELVDQKFVMCCMPEVHVHIVGADVWEHQPATVLLQNAQYGHLQATIALCQSQGYFNVRSTSQLARKIVTELDKFKFEGKPGSPAWTRRVQEQILNCFHAWGREANKTTKVAAPSTGGGGGGGKDLDFASMSTDGSTFGVELMWHNGNETRNERTLHTMDLDLHTLFWTEGMKKPVQIYYNESNRHYCTKSHKFIPSIRSGQQVDPALCPYGVETVVSHVRDATHPKYEGTETMKFGKEVKGSIRFMVVNFANPRGTCPASVHFQLRIRVGNESLKSARYRMPPHGSCGFIVGGVRVRRQACIPDIELCLLHELERVKLVQTGAPVDEPMKRDTSDELQAITLVNPEEVMAEMKAGAGIRLPLSATALNPNIRVLDSAAVEKARTVVEEHFGELTAQTMAAERLPGLVYDHRTMRPHESTFNSMVKLGLPPAMVQAMIDGTSMHIPVLQRGVFPAFPFRYTTSKPDSLVRMAAMDIAVFPATGAPAVNGLKEVSPKVATGQYTRSVWSSAVQFSGGEHTNLKARVSCVATLPLKGAFFIGFEPVAGLDEVPDLAGYDVKRAPMQPLADLVRAKAPRTVAKTVSHALQHADVPFTMGPDTCFGMVFYPGKSLNYVIAGAEHTWCNERGELPPWDSRVGRDPKTSRKQLQQSRDFPETHRLLQQAREAVAGDAGVEHALRTFRAYVEDRGSAPSSLAIDNVLKLGHGLDTFLLDGGDSLGTGGGGGGEKPPARKRARKPPNMPMEIWVQQQMKLRQKEKDALAKKERALAEIKQQRYTMQGLLQVKAAEAQKAQSEAHEARRRQFAQEAEQMRASLAILRAQAEAAQQERDRQETVIAEGDVRCPITCEVMRDPVTMIRSGQTYEREAIQAWIDAGNTTDPCTRVPIGDEPYFVDNVALRGMCRKYAEANPDV